MIVGDGVRFAKALSRRHRLGFAEDVVVHQDDVRVIGDARNFVHPARKPACATQVRLPQVHQFVAELRGHVVEQRSGLDGVGALVDDVDRVDACQQALVPRDRGDVGCAIVGPVEGADGDRCGPDRRWSRCRPFEIGDRQGTAHRGAFHPQRAAVDELVEPGRQHGGTGAVDLRARDRPRRRRGCLMPRNSSSAGPEVSNTSFSWTSVAVGPALEVARREPAEVGVGVDGRALFQMQRVAFAGALDR